MSWVRRHFGMDVIDLAIHVVMTGLLAAGVSELARGPAEDPMIVAVFAGSLLLFSWRRKRGIAKEAFAPEGLTSGQMAAVRIEELEQRVAGLEGAEARILELEERLDFTERLLARTADQAALAPVRNDRQG
ncbi:MAG: hypothetical protein ACYC2K_11320 [Gemmatimonadales bacterium]